MGADPADLFPGAISLGLNYVRNMVAHHYRSSGEPMAHVDQLFDSVNLRGMPIVTELFFPLGLRYHALHHLFPSLPYHNLSTAHRRLLEQLPAESGYRETVYPGFWSVVRDMVRNARVVSAQRRAAKRTIADEWYERRERMLVERYGVQQAVTDEVTMPDERLRQEMESPDENQRRCRALRIVYLPRRDGSESRAPFRHASR